MHRNIVLYLGFCRKYMSMQQPTLEHYASSQVFDRLVSFHHANKLISSTMKHVQTTRQVFADCSTKAGGYDFGWDKLMECVVNMAVCTLCQWCQS